MAQFSNYNYLIEPLDFVLCTFWALRPCDPRILVDSVLARYFSLWSYHFSLASVHYIKTAKKSWHGQTPPANAMAGFWEFLEAPSLPYSFESAHLPLIFFPILHTISLYFSDVVIFHSSYSSKYLAIVCLRQRQQQEPAWPGRGSHCKSSRNHFVSLSPRVRKTLCSGRMCISLRRCVSRVSFG